MNWTRVDTDVGHNFTSEAVFWNHAFYGVHYHERRVLLEHELGSHVLFATWISRIAEVELVGHFLARQNNLLGVDDNYVVAGVHMGGEHRFIFTTQDSGYMAGQTTQRHPCSVDQYPLLFDVDGLGRICLEKRLTHNRQV